MKVITSISASVIMPSKALSDADGRFFNFFVMETAISGSMTLAAIKLQ